MKRKNILIIALVTAAILAVPLVAMQFTAQVNWSPFDFIVMGGLLFLTGLLIDFALRKTGKYKLPAVGLVVFLFLWLWVELAVGLFTNWGS